MRSASQGHGRRQWHPTPVLLPGNSHRQRSLVGYSPWCSQELDTTERLPFHFSLSCIREGNGNPLQRSCLENPRDSGAWWAAIYGVAQSRTRLKRPSRIVIRKTGSSSDTPGLKYLLCHFLIVLSWTSKFHLSNSQIYYEMLITIIKQYFTY